MGAVPDTLVTVPADMAVRNADAESAETVLFELICKKLIADGFAKVKILFPTVVAPKFKRAVVAVVAPVPPFVSAMVPVTFEAVPVVF